MICPECNSNESLVINSRRKEKDGTKIDQIRRRRKCGSCEFTFTTLEITAEEFKRLKKIEVSMSTLKSMLGA